MQQSYAEDILHQFGISDIVLKYTVLYFQWICELYYCQPYVTSFICSGGKPVPNMSKD